MHVLQKTESHVPELPKQPINLQLMPYFVVDALGYDGFSGLFIAVLFSGALRSELFL